MRKTEKSLINSRKTMSKLLAIYAAILIFIAAFWVGVIWLIVNIVKWAWGA